MATKNTAFAVVDRPPNRAEPVTQPFLTTGDPNFSDLLGGRSKSAGILIPCPSGTAVSTSVLIAGYAGTGKTRLGLQLLGESLKRNNQLRQAGRLLDCQWPARAKGLIYSLDQPALELKRTLNKISGLTAGYVGLNQPTMDLGDAKEQCDVIARDRADYDHYLDLGEAVAGVKPIGITGASGDDRDADHLMFDELDVYIRYFEGARFALEELKSQLKNDVDRSNAGQQFRIVLVDPISAIHQSSEGLRDYIRSLRELIDVNRKLKHPCSLIMTLEIDDRSPALEEYLPETVLILTRSRDRSLKRYVEVRKARHQEHLIGVHEIQIKEKTINVYPSVPSRASWKDDSVNVAQLPELTFGDDRIDRYWRGSSATTPREGSATLLWGPPGSNKTELCARFMSFELREPEGTGSLLLLTSKIPPYVFEKAIQKEAALHRPNTAGNVEQLVAGRLFSVDALDPWTSHSMLFTQVIDKFYQARLEGQPIKRAVVYGLGLLAEDVLARDEQWFFLSSLVLWLSNRGISTVLVDWPIEGSSGAGLDGERGSDSILRDRRPRVSKLCANEIFCFPAKRDNLGLVRVLRGNYAGIPQASAEVQQ